MADCDFAPMGDVGALRRQVVGLAAGGERGFARRGALKGSGVTYISTTCDPVGGATGVGRSSRATRARSVASLKGLAR